MIFIALIYTMFVFSIGWRLRGRFEEERLKLKPTTILTSITDRVKSIYDKLTGKTDEV